MFFFAPNTSPSVASVAERVLAAPGRRRGVSGAVGWRRQQPRVASGAGRLGSGQEWRPRATGLCAIGGQHAVDDPHRRARVGALGALGVQLRQDLAAQAQDGLGPRTQRRLADAGEAGSDGGGSALLDLEVTVRSSVRGRAPVPPTVVIRTRLATCVPTVPPETQMVTPCACSCCDPASRRTTATTEDGVGQRIRAIPSSRACSRGPRSGRFRMVGLFPAATLKVSVAMAGAPMPRCFESRRHDACGLPGRSGTSDPAGRPGTGAARWC